MLSLCEFLPEGSEDLLVVLGAKVGGSCAVKPRIEVQASEFDLVVAWLRGTMSLGLRLPARR